MANTVIAIFQNETNAEKAIDMLREHGYTTNDMTIMVKDKGKADQLEENTGTTTADGAASGAKAGGVVGAIAGLLVGLGAIAIPGGILIGGPLIAALGISGTAGTTVAGAATGAVAGGIIGALTHLGVSESDAKSYENSLNNGGILLAVPTELKGEDAGAKVILEENGATQITSV